MELKKVKAVRDVSGHWYIIPNELKQEFDRDSDNPAFCDSGEFDNKWYKYRTGGGLNLVQLWADV